MEHMKRVTSICKTYDEIRSLKDVYLVADRKYN